MRIFFDREGIQGMDDWELRILTALRQSRVMIAVLSPAYFESEYCRKEWAWFVDRETERAMTGEAIAPVYTLTVDDFEPSPEAIPDDWPRNLKRRQYLDARPWWDEGAEAFARAEIKERLAELDQRCYEKVRQARHLEGARSTIPPHNPLFVGRSEQIRQIQWHSRSPAHRWWRCTGWAAWARACWPTSTPTCGPRTTGPGGSCCRPRGNVT